jgi:hypothetical protein
MSRQRLRRALWGRRAREKWRWAFVASFLIGAWVVCTWFPPWAGKRAHADDTPTTQPSRTYTPPEPRDTTSVPEPGTAAMAGLIGLVLLLRRPARHS